MTPLEHLALLEKNALSAIEALKVFANELEVRKTSLDRQEQELLRRTTTVTERQRVLLNQVESVRKEKEQEKLDEPRKPVNP